MPDKVTREIPNKYFVMIFNWFSIFRVTWFVEAQNSLDENINDKEDLKVFDLFSAYVFIRRCESSKVCINKTGGNSNYVDDELPNLILG
jgi:hypothetical protein